MNLKRELDRLAVLLAIKSESDEDEDKLALILLALLMAWYEGEDDNAFRLAFISALENAYLKKLEQMWIEEAGSLTSKLPDSVYSYSDMQQIIEQELSYQAGFLTRFIQDLNNNKISEKQAKARAKMYALSLGKLANTLELTMRNPDSFGQWKINPELENCSTCRELNGQVHTMRWFLRNHIPKDGNSECGQACGCRILPV